MESKKNNKFKLFGKVSVFDILIVILIAAVVVFMAYFLFLTKKEGGEKTVNYTITMYRQNIGFEKNVKVGEKIYSSTDDKYYGTIKSVNVKDHMETNINMNSNQPVLSKIPDVEDIEIVVEVNANVADRIMIDNYRLHINGEIYVKNPEFSAVGTVTAIDRASFNEG